MFVSSEDWSNPKHSKEDFEEVEDDEDDEDDKEVEISDSEDF